MGWKFVKKLPNECQCFKLLLTSIDNDLVSRKKMKEKYWVEPCENFRPKLQPQFLIQIRYDSIISLHPARPLVTNYHARRSYLEYRTILPTHDAIVKKNNNKKYDTIDNILLLCK